MRRLEELSKEEKSRIGVDLHLCWFSDCRAVWKLEEAEYCDSCDTWKCPACNRCFCDLPEEIRFAMDAEMASIGLWDPFHNPPKRKKRGGGIWICKQCGATYTDRWVSEHGLKCEKCGGELYFRPFSR